MMFGTLISQVQPISTPVRNIPSVETNNVYYSYLLNSFIEKPGLIPYTLGDFNGLGKITFVVNWDTEPADQANIKLKIKGIADIELGPTIYEIEEDFIIGVPKTIEMNYPAWSLDVSAFPVSVEFPEPSENIIRIDYSIVRCQQLYEVI